MSFKNSVLEGSGLDFGRSRARFWCLQGQIPEPTTSNVGWQLPPGRLAFWLLGSATPRQPKMPKIVKYVKKANHLQGANAQSATTKSYSTTMAGAKKGGRRWSPPGVTIRIKKHLTALSPVCQGSQRVENQDFGSHLFEENPPVRSKKW